MSGHALAWRARALVLLVGALPAASCGALRAAADAPGKVAQSIRPGEREETVRPLTDLSPALLRLADAHVWRVARAAEEFALAAGTPEAREQALVWRLAMTRSSIQIVSAPVPAMSLLQLLAVTTAVRFEHEEHWLPKVWGEPDRPMLEALQASERDIWAVAEEFLYRRQVAEVRTAIDAWLAQAREGGPGRLEPPTVAQLSSILEVQGQTSGGSLLGMIQLDPLAGLEPAAREVAQARATIERMLFWAQRLSFVVQDQLELSLLRLRRQPEVLEVLASLEQTSHALAEFSATAATLPQALSTEREAALRQVADELDAQRAGLVQDLERAQEPLQQLLGESRATLTAAATMSSELTSAVRALDDFVGRFDDEEPEPEPAQPSAAPAAAAEPAPPGKPFDVSEYGTAAERIGTSAGELRALLQELDRSLPRLEGALDTAVQRGEQTIDHAFRRGLVLGLALILAAALAVLAVRRLSRTG